LSSDDDADDDNAGATQFPILLPSGAVVYQQILPLGFALPSGMMTPPASELESDSEVDSDSDNDSLAGDNRFVYAEPLLDIFFSDDEVPPVPAVAVAHTSDLRDIRSFFSKQ